MKYIGKLLEEISSSVIWKTLRSVWSTDWGSRSRDFEKASWGRCLFRRPWG